MADFIQVKTLRKFIEQYDSQYSDKVIAKFIESCLTLDASIFEPYIQEDDVFEDLSKYEFLAQLQNAFAIERRLSQNHFRVELSKDVCRACFIGHEVHVFTTYNWNHEKVGLISYVIQEVDGKLLDISRCYYHKDLPPGIDAKIWDSKIGVGYTK
ncbi:MAG: hypothetical protein K2X26_09245 [Chitinophagaceae bacterium]|jgi:hypothetical protein|nr:hypothetical protein [Chitinophagaceae bacterium]